MEKKKISLQKKQTALLPSYTKSYSQTRIESTIFEYTWEIDQFYNISNSIDTLYSPSFPETAEYKIQMKVLLETDTYTNGPRKTTQFYLLATEGFTGLCSTTIMFPNEKSFLSNSISCRSSNMILLIEIREKDYKYCKYISTDPLKIQCKLENFYKTISKSTHMNLQPSSTLFSKDMRSLKDSILDEFDNKSEDETTINFKVGKEKYVVSKKLLHATNSSYFKNICLTHKGEEKDMTNELTNIELKTFQEMLVFIQTGSNKLSKSNYEDYNMLKNLLTTADKYDVSALKLTCEHYLLSYIMVYNATELVQLAFSSNAKFLEAHLATFIKFHIKEIMNTKEFQNLSQESLNKIMELIEKCKVPENSTEEFLSLAHKS